MSGQVFTPWSAAFWFRWHPPPSSTVVSNRVSRIGSASFPACKIHPCCRRQSFTRGLHLTCIRPESADVGSRCGQPWWAGGLAGQGESNIGQEMSYVRKFECPVQIVSAYAEKVKTALF